MRLHKCKYLMLVLQYLWSIQAISTEFEALNKELDGISSSRGFGGCEISTYKDGIAVYNYGTGVIDIDSEINIMRVASLSKSFAAVAILRLIDDNDKGITLNSTIYDVLTIYDSNEILATFELFSTLSAYMDIITISDLLSMSSGLRHYEDPWEYYWHYDNNETLSVLYEKLELFGDDELFRQPRSGYKYSSFGYGIIGVLIQVISGQSFYEYIDTIILDKIGLENTGNMETIDSSRYVKQNKLDCIDTDRGYKILRNCVLNDTYSSEYYDQVVWYKTSAGGLLSTTMDLCKYADDIVWNRNNILSDTMHSEMFKGQTYVKTVTDKGDDWYGFGWHMYWDDIEKNTNYIWHTGGAIGGVSRLTITKDIQLIVAVNCDTQSGQSGITQIADYVEQYFRDYDGSDNEENDGSDNEEKTNMFCLSLSFVIIVIHCLL